jgi:hypothetical protein
MYYLYIGGPGNLPILLAKWTGNQYYFLMVVVQHKHHIWRILGDMVNQQNVNQNIK